MDNKKIDMFFYLIIIVSILSFLLLIKDFEIKRTYELKSYRNSINSIIKAKDGIIQSKDDVIKSLFKDLAEKENENEVLSKILSDTRNELEGLSKKLTQPIAVAAPEGAPAAPAAEPASASATTSPAAVTK